MTFEYDAFKDAVYISSQAAKDPGIDEIIYHPKNHEFSFFNKFTALLILGFEYPSSFTASCT